MNISLRYFEENFGKDPGFINEIVKTIAIDLESKHNLLRKYVNEGDWEKIKKTAHSTKASVKMLDAVDLFKYINEMEELALSRQPIDKLKKVLDKSTPILKEVIQELNSIHYH